jgi:hypothetical protein
VSPRPGDPWRLPTLGRFGAQLRELEGGAPTTSAIPRSSVSRRGILLSGGGVGAALIAIVLILTAGRPAQARTVVNEAPGAAERSHTVRFESVLEITIAGHRRPGIAERGAIDFASGAYVTTVRFGNAGEVLERRSAGGVLYGAEHLLRRGARPERIRWVAAPLERGAFSSEGDAFTDPHSVFRALSGIRAPVRRSARERLNGVPVTRYHVMTDLDSFLRPSEGHVENPLVYRRVRASLDVWIDARGRPLQVEETFTGGSSSGPTTMNTVVRFTGYGRPVSVPAPAGFVLRSSKGIAPANPLAAGPESVLARRLFFQPSVGPQPPAPAGRAGRRP